MFLNTENLTEEQKEKVNKMMIEFHQENKDKGIDKDNSDEYNISHLFGAESEIQKFYNFCQENKIINYDYNAKRGNCKMTFENEDGKEETVEYDI